MNPAFATVLVWIVLVCSAPAQQASYTTYGSGCGGWHGEPPIMPTLSATGLPRLGARFRVEYRAPSFSCRYGVFAYLATGVSAVSVPMPFIPYVFYGGPNCTILTSAEVTILRIMGQFPTGGMDVDVPNSPALLGVVLYQQWWLYYSVTCPIGSDVFLFVTNGGKLTIGT